MTDAITTTALTGDTGTTAQTTTATSQTATTQQTSTQAAPAVAWLGEGVAPELVGYAQNKGWQSPKDLLESYQNLEKMRGVPAERLLTLPAGDADDAAKAAFWEKLGRPKEAAGYDFKFEGDDASFTDGIKGIFHKHNLTGDQAKGVIADYAEMVKTQTETQKQAAAQKLQAEQQQLVAEWGTAAQHRASLAVKGAEVFGLNQGEFDTLIQTFGPKRAGNLLANLAERSGIEADFVAGAGGGGNGPLTPAQAQAKLAELKRNPDWAAKALKPGTAEQQEMRRLIQFQTAGR